MLYKYTYIKKHAIHGLNKHVNFFFRKIRAINPTASFDLNQYFHPDFVEILNDSPKLLEKFRSFFNTYKVLSATSKENFYQIVIKCQSIELFYEDVSVNCHLIDIAAINSIINNSTLSELMNYLFSTTLKTKRWQIEDHYKKIYHYMPPHKICPFCGVGEMHNSFREDYDHLAPKKFYPLLALNLKNLAPMCSSCNTKFKGETDIFYLGNIRRPFAYPYSTEINVRLDFSNSIIPDTDIHNLDGVWKVDFIPYTDTRRSWADIFQIRKRYIVDYIEPKFDIWIDLFLDDLLASQVEINNNAGIKDELDKASQRYYKHPFMHSNIIKAPLFKFLAESNNAVFYGATLKKFNSLKAVNL